MANLLKKCLQLTKISILTAFVLSALIIISFELTQLECGESTKIIVASVILLIMYALMIFEIVNRTMAAMIGAVMAIAAHDYLIGFVSMEDVIRWEDLETLSLLFGMMVIVNVLSTSGLFNFLAIWCYKKSNGRFWYLIIIMSIITGLLSALIDNVSTMLLMSPTLIKLSELEHIDPRYVLMIMVVFCNIGGCATPVGDPPNLIIIGDSLISDLGITFSSFVAYCLPGVVLTFIVSIIYLKLRYKSKESFRLKSSLDQHDRNHHNDPELSANMMEVVSRKHQMTSSSKNQMLEEVELLTSVQKQLLGSQKTHINPTLLDQISEEISTLELMLDDINKRKKSLSSQLPPLVDLETSLDVVRRSSRMDDNEIAELLKTNGIKNGAILYQSLSVISVTVFLFFFQSFVETPLTLGWISLFAALVLLIMSSSIRMKNSGEEFDDEEGDEDSFEFVISKIEWSTLMFFFALFIVMEAISKLGLISFIGSLITRLVDTIPAGKTRELGAITIILWSSALASAVIDNVPFTSMMVKVLGSLIMKAGRADTMPSTSLIPLVFALAFGACFGGNGTIIGASANLVTAGVSLRSGYPISFNSFAKFAAPLTIISLIVANVYLVFVFVLLGL